MTDSGTDGRDDPYSRVRALCEAFPGALEHEAWGDPAWRVGGRIFAILKRDGERAAVWVKASRGAQSVLVAARPDRFFVPPYVGQRGWIGIRLAGDDWGDVAHHLRESYRLTVPQAAVGRGADLLED